MLNIKINGIKRELKPCSELTTKEYIEFNSKITEKSNSFDLLIYIIAIITDCEVNNVRNVNINNTAITRLNSYLGIPLHLNNIPEIKEFYYHKTGRIYYQHKLDWQTFGVRSLFNNFKTDNPLEQMVYLLAAMISHDYDYDNNKTTEIYDNLMKQNYLDVFSFAVFFFKSIKNGTKSGSNLCQKLKRVLHISTVELSSK